MAALKDAKLPPIYTQKDLAHKSRPESRLELRKRNSSSREILYNEKKKKPKKTTVTMVTSTAMKDTILPPIYNQVMSTLNDYDHSFLLKFKMDTKKQEIIRKEILQAAERCKTAIKEENDRIIPITIPQYPIEMMSKARAMRENYLDMRMAVWNGPVNTFQHEWFDNILQRIPEKLIKNFLTPEKRTQFYNDVSFDFEKSMRVSKVQHVLIMPDINGLTEADKAGPPPSLPTGLDYSQNWHEKFVANRKFIMENLHLLDPLMRKLLNYCQTTLSNMSILQCFTYRAAGAINLSAMRANVSLELEKAEEKNPKQLVPIGCEYFL